MPTTRRSPSRQFARRLLERLAPSSRLLFRRPAGERRVYLTFDDGPDPTTTPRVLDLLARHDARATFFVLGAQAARHPQIVARAAAEGHAIGGHTFDHASLAGLSSAALHEQLDRTDRVVRDCTGSAPRLFRPPYGKLTAGHLLRLWRRGCQVVLWNRDPKDFAAGSSTDVLAHFQSAPLDDGDVVLLHDTSRPSVAALDRLLSAGAASGLQFAALPG